jgi:hypothetical protein
MRSIKAALPAYYIPFNVQQYSDAGKSDYEIDALAALRIPYEMKISAVFSKDREYYGIEARRASSITSAATLTKCLPETTWLLALKGNMCICAIDNMLRHNRFKDCLLLTSRILVAHI